ncbi:MAG TPA: DUF6541 family protein [Microbacterium sp.]|nr:DUF6541 family protein [Microbacterium sp.]
MLEWLAQTPVMLAGILVVFVPGILALWGVGLRGLALFAAAPLFGVATVGVSALALGAVGVAWSPLSWAISTLVVIGVAWVLGRLLGHRLPEADVAGPRWLLIVALVIGVAIGIWRLGTYISDPAGISQTNDAVFHMNAVRFVLETGDASSLHVNAVIGGRSFYPAAWHGIVSLMVAISGASISVAANMLTLLIGALIWSFGIAWLARELTSSRSVAAYAAVLSSALQTFPLLMFQWGVLFPNALSTALIPAGVALVAALPRWSTGGPPWRAGVRAVLLVLVTAGALLLAQPAAFLPWAAISVVWLSFHLLLRPGSVRRWPAILAVVLAWIALIVIWLRLAQGTSGAHWGAFRGNFEVFLDVLFNGQVMIPFAFGMSVLMLVGLVVAVRTARYRWFAVAWLGISGLYVLVAAVDSAFIRNNILGAWYADPYRIAALAPVVVIPLAALAVDAIVRLIARALHKPVDGRSAAIAGLVGTTVFMIVLVIIRPVAMPAVTEGSYDRDSRYLAFDDTFLSVDERALLESLDEYVEPGARVIGNPSTGTGFGYFLSGVDVYPRTWAPPSTATWPVLAQHLRDAATDPEVCDVLDAYGDPQYVLDFGKGETGAGRYIMPGMTDFADQEGFDLVAERGDVSLWRITACAE